MNVFQNVTIQQMIYLVGVLNSAQHVVKAGTEICGPRRKTRCDTPTSRDAPPSLGHFCFRGLVGLTAEQGPDARIRQSVNVITSKRTPGYRDFAGMQHVRIPRAVYRRGRSIQESTDRNPGSRIIAACEDP